MNFGSGSRISEIGGKVEGGCFRHGGAAVGLGHCCARGRARSGGRWLGLAHVFLAEYGRGLEKIIRAHSALGWEGRGYWGLWGLEIGNFEKSGKLILGNLHKHWVEMGWGEKVVGNFPKSGERAMF